MRRGSIVSVWMQIIGVYSLSLSLFNLFAALLLLYYCGPILHDKWGIFELLIKFIPVYCKDYYMFDQYQCSFLEFVWYWEVSGDPLTFYIQKKMTIVDIPNGLIFVAERLQFFRSFPHVHKSFQSAFMNSVTNSEKKFVTGIFPKLSWLTFVGAELIFKLNVFLIFKFDLTHLCFYFF